MLLIGDLLVVDVDVVDDEVIHQPGFFVGHVVATLGLLELVLEIGVDVVESVGRPGDGG